MSKKYVYHGIDITLDIYEKIKSVAELLSERDNLSFTDACLAFYRSPVYRTLQNTETVLWSESPKYILNEYDRKKFNNSVSC